MLLKVRKTNSFHEDNVPIWLISIIKIDFVQQNVVCFLSVTATRLSTAVFAFPINKFSLCELSMVSAYETHNAITSQLLRYIYVPKYSHIRNYKIIFGFIMKPLKSHMSIALSRTLIETIWNESKLNQVIRETWVNVHVSMEPDLKRLFHCILCVNYTALVIRVLPLTRLAQGHNRYATSLLVFLQKQVKQWNCPRIRLPAWQLIMLLHAKHFISNSMKNLIRFFTCLQLTNNHPNKNSHCIAVIESVVIQS